MPPVGPTADRVQSLIPITWDALQGDPRVPSDALQGAINLAQENTFGSSLTVAQEETYPYVAIDYAAKLAVMEICRTGIDYWMNQALSVDSTGTNEHLSYIDRAGQLEKLREDLISETRQLAVRVGKLLNIYIDDGRAVPQLSSANINPFFNTPSPEEFPRPYRQTPYSSQ